MSTHEYLQRDRATLELVSYLEMAISQFIEDTIEPSVFLPGIISMVIMCIGII